MFNPTGDAESNQTPVISSVPVIQHQHSRNVLSTLIPSKYGLPKTDKANSFKPHGPTHVSHRHPKLLYLILLS